MFQSEINWFFLKSTGLLLQGLALKGWIELMAGRDAAKKALKYFDESLA